MKRGFCYFAFGLTFLALFFVSSAQAQTWKELYDQADSLQKVADYDSAIVVGKSALEKVKKEFGEEDTATASVLTLLGRCYYKRGHYTEATDALTGALNITKRLLAPEHPNLARVLHWLGNVCFSQGKYSEAESLYRQAISIRESSWS